MEQRKEDLNKIRVINVERQIYGEPVRSGERRDPLQSGLIRPDPGRRRSGALLLWERLRNSRNRRPLNVQLQHDRTSSGL